MTHHPLPLVNLVPRCYRERRLRAKWRMRWGVLVTLTTVLVALPCLYIGGSAALTDSGMSHQIESTRTQVATHRQAIPQLEARLRLLRAEQEVLDLVGNRVDWRRLLTGLVATAGDDIRFSGAGFRGAGVEGRTPIEIRLDGFARSQTGARDFVVRLERTGLCDSVRLTRSSRRMIGDQELIEFTVHIGVGEASSGEGGDAG